MLTCEKCGAEITIGAWPWCPHGKPAPQYVFQPYFDIGLGREITSYADRWKAMRELNVQYRDLPSKGDLSARADRAHEARKAQGR